MKKSNSTKKAQSVFKKLGAVALMVATLAVFFTACNQTGGGGGEKPNPAPAPAQLAEATVHAHSKPTQRPGTRGFPQRIRS